MANNCSLVSDSSKYFLFRLYLICLTPHFMISVQASLLGPSFLVSTSNLDYRHTNDLLETIISYGSRLMLEIIMSSIFVSPQL